MISGTAVCQLGYDPTKRGAKDNPARCASEDCQRCGWNPEECRRRRALRQSQELTMHPDGLKGLVIRRSGEAVQVKADNTGRR